MKHVLLESADDLNWLYETHLNNALLPDEFDRADYPFAELIGNEDSPDYILLIAENSIDSHTLLMIPDFSRTKYIISSNGVYSELLLEIL